jgi:hypothetical protein
MNVTDDNTIKDAGQKVIARALKERRRFRRVHVAITGRLYIPATQEEAMCTVEDISPGDACILCELKEEPRGRAVIYLDTLGRFEGPVVRARNGGFVMTFSCSLQKREKLADQLALEMNRHLLSETDLRKYDRVEALNGSFTHFIRSTGEQIRCEVLDLSFTGVSVRSESKPPVGEHILIGHRAGRVARHHGEGIGIEFLGGGSAAANGVDAPPAATPLRSIPSAAPRMIVPSAMAQAARR